METTKIIATAWENGSGSYGFQLKEEDRKRYFTRSSGGAFTYIYPAGRCFLLILIRTHSGIVHAES